MEYKIEELIPIVDQLTKKYTSNDSTSITYEVAKQLMGAIMYCINAFHQEGSFERLLNKVTDAEFAYKQGFDIVVSKVYKSKEIYEHIIKDFYDFRCQNCSDTIIKGMPIFFVKYDPLFNPGDHILTLDYPTLQGINALHGIDAIYQYLNNIRIEWQFLNAYKSEHIEYLLKRINPDYENLYLDNISYDVLLISLGCVLVDKPVGELVIDKNDLDDIYDFFKNDVEERVEQKIRFLISNLFAKGFHGNSEMEKYFKSVSKDYAIRIASGVRYRSLDNVFGI